MEDKKRGTLKSKLFLVCLIAIFVLALVGLTNPTLLGLTVGKAVQTVAYEKAGSELFFEVKNIKGVEYVTVNFLEDVKDIKIEFEEVNKVSWGFEGAAYSQFKISSQDEQKIGRLDFSLKLKEGELKGLGLEAEEVRLYGDGQELGTTLIKLEGDYIDYKATAWGMGEFVIGKKAAAKAEEKKTVEEKVEEVKAEILEKIEPVTEKPKQFLEEQKKEGVISKVKSFFENLFG